MSSYNELEIIYRGSVEVVCTSESSSAQEVPTTDVKVEHTMTLEPLPPERPRCPGVCVSDEAQQEFTLEEEESAIPVSLELASQELAQSRQQTESLLERIEHLSSQIRSGLSLVGQSGATVPALPAVITASDDRGGTNDVMMMSSYLDEALEHDLVTLGGDGSSQMCDGEGGDNEGGGGRGVVSPEGGEVNLKLVKALEKMRRLDKRLADIVAREREVKDQRRHLELQMTEEIDVQPYHDTHDGGGGVSLPPVFQTQLTEDTTHHTSTDHDTDFILRNIEEVGVAVVLSESEENRLDQLIAQDDEEMAEDASTASVNAENNVFKLSAESQTALTHIDNQLEAMGGCGEVRGSTEQQQLVSAGQRMREIDEKLAELKKSSPQPEGISPSALQHLLSAQSRE